MLVQDSFHLFLNDFWLKKLNTFASQVKNFEYSFKSMFFYYFFFCFSQKLAALARTMLIVNRAINSVLAAT